jgi:hypothetical protein
MTNILYTWQFEDKKQRSQLWYIIAFSVVIGLVVWWFLTKQYGMSFIVLLLSWLMLFVENNSEDTVTVNISDMWIYIWENFYEFDGIEKYATWYVKDNAEFIRIYLAKKGIALLDIKTNNEIIGDIQNILNNYIQHDGKVELSSSDKIIRFLKL